LAIAASGCELALGLNKLSDLPADGGTSSTTGDGAAAQNPDGSTSGARDAGNDAARTPDSSTTASDASTAGDSSVSSPDATADAATDAPGTAGDSSTPEGGAVAATSCVQSGAGLNNCGSGGSGSESCCTSLPVTGGGPFNRTYTSLPDGGPSAAADPATVSSFNLDKYEITVGRFRQFVTAFIGGWRPAVGSGKHTHLHGGSGLSNSGAGGGYEGGWQTAWTADLSPAKTGWDSDLQSCDTGYTTWTTSVGSQENLPINCIDWYDAYAFCIWDGGFLPSEAEWEYAAAGGTEEREYAWGSDWPGIDTSTQFKYAISNCSYPDFSGSSDPPCDGTRNMGVVGFPYLGAGKYGQLDLIGNMFEWNLDTYDVYTSPCTDCANVSSNAAPVIRGGAYDSGSDDLQPQARNNVSTPTWRYESIGARCARTP